MSKSLLKSTSVVSTMTLISRVLGFVRDMIVAQIFGATAGADAFYVAFKIPNFMRALFAEGSFSQAFVPVLSDYRQRSNPEEVRTFISHVFGGLGSLLFIITVLGVIGAPLLVHLFGPGLDPYRFHLASSLLRITFPYLMLISLAAFVGAILNCYHAFAIPSFTPALLNLCMMAAALLLTPYFPEPVTGLAWGVFIAGIVQFLFQLPFLYKKGLLTRPRIAWRDPGVQRILKLMLPALFGASVGQISLLLNTIFASFLAVGSVSWLYYSDRLAYFPLGVFGVALATVVLPHLSRHHSSESPHEFSATLDWGIRCNLLIGIPAALTMMILAGPLVITLFQRGNFTFHDVLMTRQSVMAYSVGLLAFMLIKVLSTAFYAKQNVRAVVRIGVYALIANMILNALLIIPLAHAGLALASSLAAWINTGLLGYALHRLGILRFQQGWSAFAMRLLFANGVLGILLWYGAGDLNDWLSWHWQQRFSHVFLLGMAAVIIYLGCLFLSGMRLHDIKVRPVNRPVDPINV